MDPTKKKFSLASIPKKKIRTTFCAKNTTTAAHANHYKEMWTTLQLQDQKSCRRVCIASDALCEDTWTQPKRSSL